MIVFVAHTDNCLYVLSSYKINVPHKLYASRLVLFVRFSFSSFLCYIYRPVARSRLS